MSDRVISGHSITLQAEVLSLLSESGTVISFGPNVGGVDNDMSKFGQTFSDSAAPSYNGANGVVDIMYTKINQEVTTSYTNSTLWSGTGNHLIIIPTDMQPSYFPAKDFFGPCTVVNNGSLAAGLFKIDTNGFVSIGLVTKQGDPDNLDGGEIGFLAFSATYRTNAA